MPRQSFNISSEISVMSGLSVLEEITSWDEEKRIDKIEEALPRLIQHQICFEKHGSREEAVGILQVLCQSFVPLVPQEQLELKVFSKLSQEVCNLLDGILEDLHQAVTEGQEINCNQLTDLLQSVITVLQCTDDSVRHMSRMSEVQPCQVRSLMRCSFHALKKSYAHCQESSSLYGDNLPQLSDSLSLLFRTAHSLQMTLLSVIEKLTAVHLDNKQYAEDITEVCQSLFALCRLVACLDLKLTISLWKALSKLAGQQPGVLYQHIDICGIVCYLCDEIRNGIVQLFQSAPPLSDQNEMTLSQGSEKLFTKSIRILNFQMKILVALLRDFHDHVDDSVYVILKLILFLNSVMPPSLTAVPLPEKQNNELRQQLLCAVQPVVAHLLNNTTFTSSVLDIEDLEKNSEFSLLLLRVTVMDSVSKAPEEVVAQWLDTPSPAANLLSAVLAVFNKCHVEVFLPVYLLGSPCEGKRERSISLYQFVIEHVCAFIACCPAKYFHVIERELLSVLLGVNLLVSQAAVDCWCFMARCGTAAVRWHHCQQLLSVLLQLHSVTPVCPAGSPLSSLLSRLLQFLTPQQQMDFVSRVPSASCISVWSDLGLRGMDRQVASQLTQSLLSPCLGVLHKFCQTVNPSDVHMASVIPSLRCLHNIIQSETTVHCLTAQHGALLLDLVTALLVKLASYPLANTSTSSDSGITHCYLSALMTLTSDLVGQLESKILLQVLKVADKLLMDSTSGDLKLAVVHLMQSLSSLKFPLSSEQGQILVKIGDLFVSGLTHKQALVQYMALWAFTRFAEQTVYETLVPEILSRHDGLQEQVAAYLQKIPYPSDRSFEPASYLHIQYRMLQRLQHTSDASETLSAADFSEPQNKRQRLEDSVQFSEAKHQVLDDLEALTQKLETLKAVGNLPQWVALRGKSLLQRLAACLEHC